MSQRPVPPRGMRDVLPAEGKTRRHLLETIVSVFESHGYDPIESPILEDLERLTDSEGGDNTKLIYKVLKRRIDWSEAHSCDADVADLGLRYDLTVPLARYFASNEPKLSVPFKAIQTGPVFRAERPQRGRYRQFVQCDIDVIGTSDITAEVELIRATVEALTACGVQEVGVRMNHRRLLDSVVASAGFSDADKPAVLIALDKFDKVGIDGVRAELQAIAPGATDAIVDMVGELQKYSSAADAQQASGADSFGGIDDMVQIESMLARLAPEIRLEFDATLVRGQGYYTGPIFEVTIPGLDISLGGGGRYDTMIERLSGISAPAVGMSIGFERLADLLVDADAYSRRRIVVLFDEGNWLEANRAGNELRRQSNDVRVERSTSNRRAQLERLGHAGYTHFCQFDNGLTEVQSITTKGSQ
jgi:histidyl-tRNA synthetase